MFTGIVEELGVVVAADRHADGARLRVRAEKVTSDAAHGDSIAVDGVCLTVVETANNEFAADVMQESLNRSTLGHLQPGAAVNLERAVRSSDRLGGHFVQGHVDGTATILERTRSDLVRIGIPHRLARYVAEKGSIAVDGVSLTVASVDDDAFTVALIPATLELTTLGGKQPGAAVNLEVDVIAKYVERLLTTTARPHDLPEGRRP